MAHAAALETSTASQTGSVNFQLLLSNDLVEKQKMVTYVRTEETSPESEVWYHKFGWVNLPAQMTHEGPS